MAQSQTPARRGEQAQSREDQHHPKFWDFCSKLDMRAVITMTVTLITTMTFYPILGFLSLEVAYIGPIDI